MTGGGTGERQLEVEKDFRDKGRGGTIRGGSFTNEVLGGRGGFVKTILMRKEDAQGRTKKSRGPRNRDGRVTRKVRLLKRSIRVEGRKEEGAKKRGEKTTREQWEMGKIYNAGKNGLDGKKGKMFTEERKFLQTKSCPRRGIK